jgi:hypothetical protein
VKAKPECYLNSTPNEWGCHDPQCNDSTWDHPCPVGPCTVPEHQGFALPEKRIER